MNQLLATVIPLSLGAAVSPTVLVAVMLTLSGRIAPRARAWAGVAGMAFTLVLIMVAAGWLAHYFAAVRPDPLVLDGTDIVGAIILLGLGIRGILRLKTPPAHGRAERHAASDKPELVLYLGLGVVLMLTDVTSIVLFLPAVKDIAKSSIETAEKVAVAFIPFFCVLAPALIPTALSTVAPRTADRLLKPLNAWVTKNSRAIGIVVCFVFAAYLAWKGGTGLLH